MAERRPPQFPEMPPGEPEPTEEEIAASERLRDALEDASIASEEAELARSLRAAFAPEPIAESENRELVAGALPEARRAEIVEIPEVPQVAHVAEIADASEIAAAETLRAALEDPSIANEGASLARALAAAWAPNGLSDAEHRAIVERALAAGGKVVPLRPRGSVVRVAFGVSVGALALAAAFVVLVRAPRGGEVALAHARSTQPLFNEPFKAGETSTRIDRIAVARAADYRDNRFAQWGVR